MTWDWIVDTLRMIEDGLAEREKIVDRNVTPIVMSARSATIKARTDVERAIHRMWANMERAGVAREVQKYIGNPEDF